LTVALAGLLSAAPAYAQGTAATNQVSGGLTLQEWNSDFAESKGFGIDFAHFIWGRGDNQGLSILVDFARNRFSGEETDTSFLAGGRWSFMRGGRVSLFVQATIGVMRWREDDGDSGSDLMAGAGGGVIVQLAERIGAKAQIDFWRANSDLLNRLFFGIVIFFGQ
jgi:hypothetical protein